MFKSAPCFALAAMVRPEPGSSASPELKFCMPGKWWMLGRKKLNVLNSILPSINLYMGKP